MKVLVTGGCGQIGTDLVQRLWKENGEENVILADLRTPPENLRKGVSIQVDCSDKKAMEDIFKKYSDIKVVYHLVGILSAVGEDFPKKCWTVNMATLEIILDLCVEYKIEKLFWPSSIAAFGESSVVDGKVPQVCVLEPKTIYGVTKVSGELLCKYYNLKYRLDARSLRIPGLISYKSPPGGGTTDYAVDIFRGALSEEKTYECFVRSDTKLPMMYMDDAVEGFMKLMEAPADKISVRTSYNFTALEFTVEELEKVIQKRIPEFKVTYKVDPDRQRIADSWPDVVDDSVARADWDWKHHFDVEGLVDAMLENLPEYI